MFGSTMAVPALASYALEDGVFGVYPATIAITWACGAVLWWCARKEQRELQARHGIILVAFVWMVFPLFAAMPLYWGFDHIDRPLSWKHAYF